MGEQMTFPDTWDEFEELYGFNDTEEIYTNGSRLIQSFRVKQWLEHIRETAKKTNGNLINRQAAIDAIYDWSNHSMTDAEAWHLRQVIGDIKSMPSVRTEIIRCEDCKYYKEWESEFTPNAVVTQCMADNFSIRKAIPDGWFCAGAERKRK